MLNIATAQCWVWIHFCSITQNDKNVYLQEMHGPHDEAELVKLGQYTQENNLFNSVMVYSTINVMCIKT